MKNDKIRAFFTGLKNAVMLMPVTLILVIAATLLFVCFTGTGLEINGINIEETIITIAGTLVFTAFGAFFAETNIQKKGWKIAVIVLCLLFSGAYLFELQKDYMGFSKPFQEQFVLFGLAGYSLIAIALGLSALFRKSGLAFSEYVTGVFMNWIKWSIITGILEIGVMLLAVIFSRLILDSETMILRVIGLVTGIIIVPGALLLLDNVHKEDGKFPKVLISYVVFPLVVLAYLIIYIYMAKCLITSEIPSNSVFVILAAIFLVGAPSITMAESVNDSRFYQRFTRILFILFIPFILLQCYAVGIRIHEYGITPSRYIGLICIVIEIIYVLLSLFRKEMRGLILPVLAVLALIAFLIPGINLNSVSKQNQQAALERFMDAPSAGKARRAHAAYSYLSGQPEEIRTVLTDMTDAEKQELKELIDAYRDEDEGEELIPDDEWSKDWFNYTAFEYDEQAVPVNGYQSVKTGYMDWSFYVHEAFTMDELKEVKLYASSGECIQNVDMREWIEAYLEYADSHYDQDLTTGTGYDEKYRLIHIDDKTDVYLNYFSVSGGGDGNKRIPDYITADVLILYK